MKIDLSKIENNKFSVNVSHFRIAKPRGVVVVFPGAGYSFMGPCFYYSTNALYELGFEIFNFEYDFRRIQLEDNSIASYKEFRGFLISKLNEYELPKNKIALCKSIGTRVIASDECEVFEKIIWITPAIKDDFVLNSIAKNAKKSLSIIGSEDPFYDSDILSNLEHLGARSVVIQGADHGLDIDSNINQSLDNMKVIVDEIINYSSF